MYTRCPSCRAEISFEPPANAANLPDGYKHKIKCPSCGVTIGVKIPKLDASVQPVFAPQNPNAVVSEPVYSASTTPIEIASPVKKAYGVGANVVLLLLSAILAIIGGLGYLVAKGTINVEIFSGFALFNGISVVEELAKGLISTDNIPALIVYLLPTITMALAAINAVVGIVCAAVGKYSRVYNVIMGVLIGGASICTLLRNFLLPLTVNEVGLSISEYFEFLIEGELYLAFVAVGIGVLIMLLSLCFIAVKKKKATV